LATEKPANARNIIDNRAPETLPDRQEYGDRLEALSHSVLRLPAFA
jgi:hypothetical protein